jgi:hypothetical protein
LDTTADLIVVEDKLGPGAAEWARPDRYQGTSGRFVVDVVHALNYWLNASVESAATGQDDYRGGSLRVSSTRTTKPASGLVFPQVASGCDETNGAACVFRIERPGRAEKGKLLVSLAVAERKRGAISAF